MAPYVECSWRKISGDPLVGVSFKAQIYLSCYVVISCFNVDILKELWGVYMKTNNISVFLKNSLSVSLMLDNCDFIHSCLHPPAFFSAAGAKLEHLMAEICIASS